MRVFNLAAEQIFADWTCISGQEATRCNESDRPGSEKGKERESSQTSASASQLSAGTSLITTATNVQQEAFTRGSATRADGGSFPEGQSALRVDVVNAGFDNSSRDEGQINLSLLDGFELADLIGPELNSAGQLDFGFY